MAISDKLTSIQNHLTDDWDSIESLIGDTDLDKNIENIAGSLDNLYNELPKVTGSGTSITLEDTRKGRIESELGGNTSQFTTTGKNLLGLADGSNTSGGLNVTRANNVITFSGTASSTYPNTGNVPYTLGAGTYTISSTNNDYDFYLWFRNSNNDTIYTANLSKGTKTITVSTNDIASVVIGVEHLTINTQYTLSTSIQIEQGSSATSFEPFTNGASPNPDYPQDIHVVSGDNEIVINSKNLFAGGNTTTHNGITFTKNNDGSYNIVGTATSSAYLLNYVPLGESGIINGETYTISLNKTIQDLELRIESYNGNTWLRATMGSLATFPKTHSADVTGATSVRFGLFVSSGKTVNITNLKIMLEKGSSANSYLPCSRDAYNIDLPVENLFDISTTSTNTYLNTNGTTGSSSVTCVSDYILVNSGDIMTFSYEYSSLANTSGRNCCYYDESKDFVSYFTIDPSVKVRNITIPSGAKYLRLGYDKNCTNIQLQQSSKATPYGTTPIEMCKIGNYQDYFGKSDGRNLFDKDNLTIEIGTISATGTFDYSTERLRAYYIEVDENTTYTVSTSNSDLQIVPYFYNSSKTFLSFDSGWKDFPYTFTTPSNTKYVALLFKNSNNTPNVGMIGNLQLEKGSSFSDYQPYGVGKWYKYGAIGKIVFTGTSSEYYQINQNWDGEATNILHIFTNDVRNTWKKGQSGFLSNKFICTIESGRDYTQEMITCHTTNETPYFFISYDRLSDVSSSSTAAQKVNAFKQWLSSNNVTLYYILATPTITELTYQPLIDQLNLLEKSMSKDRQTNISQVNNDLPFKIEASALQEWSV